MKLIPCVIFLVGLIGILAAEEAAKRPNILLIVADDMGYGDLSCNGSKQIQTPNLDRLAASGVLCTDGYVSNNVCAPSRAGILTGRYGSRFGFEHNLNHPDYLKSEYAGVPLDEPMISDRLKELGYRTGMVGKWHLGDSVAGHHPNARGFDFFFGFMGGGHAYFPKADHNQLSINREKVTEIRTAYLTDWLTLEALDFIHGKGKAVDTVRGKSDAPWFLYLAYNSPHSPMQAKEEDLKKFAQIKVERRRIYCAMQHCMDENIGKILDDLENRGELDNTLIVFISDNGGSVEVSYAVNAPLRGSKGTYYEGGIRVPTIYHWPAKLKPGVYREPVISLDFMATFVKAAGGVPPESGMVNKREGVRKKLDRIYDSVDLIPYFTGVNPGKPHEILFWRTALRGEAVRMGDWKLLRPNSAGLQLYNVKNDISETNNVASTHPDIVNEILKKKVDWEVSCERAPMFMSDMYYTDYNRRLYEMQYQTTQPEPDDDKNVWLMPK